MNKRRFAFRAAAILILVGIAAWMMVIGRGHTVYIDNKTLEYEGQTYKAFHRATVYVNGEKVSKLAARPGYMAGLPQEAWMTEFVSTPTEAEMQEEAPGEEEDILAGAEF